MLFTSYPFVIGFLPLALAGHALAGRVSADAAKLWLIAASLAFYASFGLRFLPFLLCSVAGNLLAARLIHAARTPGRRTAVTTLAVAANLAALIWCRYLSTWLSALDSWFGASVAIPDPIIPLGISFFTFTQIGYLLDCRVRLEPRRRAVDQILFAVLFPSLISGPILTAREVMPQIAERRVWRLDPEDAGRGLALFLIGFLKKTLLADPLAPAVATGFAHPEALTALTAWQAALSWSLQLYFDFSGYSDMAIGLARMFGLRLPLNFNSPYRARSVIAYWQRWHMSLTRFFMATLHAPLTMAIMRRRRGHGLGTNRNAVHLKP